MSRSLSKLLLFEFLIVTVSWCSEPVRLRDVVEVLNPKVMLSDLLSSYTPAEGKRRFPAMEICDSPQPGGTRLLRREQIVQRMRQSAANLDAVIIPDTVMVRNPGVPITEELVRSAISTFLLRRGWQSGLPKDSSLAFPRVVTAAESAFQIEVTRADWDSRQNAIDLHLRCLKRPGGSFLAYLYLPDSFPQAARSDLLRTILSNPTVAERRSIRQPALVTRGRPATLILQDATTQILLPVVCLQAGSLSQNVRVFDKMSRQVFEAEVVGRNLLRAGL